MQPQQRRGNFLRLKTGDMGGAEDQRFERGANIEEDIEEEESKGYSEVV